MGVGIWGGIQLDLQVAGNAKDPGQIYHMSKKRYTICITQTDRTHLQCWQLVVLWQKPECFSVLRDNRANSVKECQGLSGSHVQTPWALSPVENVQAKRKRVNFWQEGIIWWNYCYFKFLNLASYHTRESGGIRGWSFTLENPSTANKHLYPLMDWCSLLHVSEIRERAFKHHDVKSISNISKAQKLLGAFKNILGVQNDWMVDFKLTSVDRWNSFPEILQWKFLPP